MNTDTTSITATIVRYDIVDRHTGKIIAAAKTRAAANRIVDRKDLAYGAYRYTAKAIWSDEA